MTYHELQKHILDTILGPVEEDENKDFDGDHLAEE